MSTPPDFHLTTPLALAGTPSETVSAAVRRAFADDAAAYLVDPPCGVEAVWRASRASILPRDWTVCSLPWRACFYN